VLRLIWLGKIKDCADLAVAASFGRYQDLYTAITAGRALVSPTAAIDAALRIGDISRTRRCRWV
jgi:hypothetical protein